MAHPLIAAALAAPKTHKVVTTYDDGTNRIHETRSEQTAENYAIGERRKIGRRFLSRVLNEWAMVVSVEVTKIEG